MLGETSEEFHEKVCRNFNTSVQQVKEDVEVLKGWIRQQPHLPQTTSDTLLIGFIIASKNRMERAKERVDNYYTVRLEMPQFFGSRDPEEEAIRQINELVWIFNLPKATPDGCYVTMINYRSDKTENYDLPALCRRALIVQDVRMNAEPFTTGVHCIMDCKCYTAGHLARLTPTMARDFMHCVQNSFPILLKSVIVINSPTYAQIAFNIIRPFLKKKLSDRLHVHTEGPEVLEKYFDKKILPRDYGGEEEPSEKIQEAWNKLLREKRDWLMTDGAVTVDETKRIGGNNSKKGYEEMQGSFKKLCVD